MDLALSDEDLPFKEAIMNKFGTSSHKILETIREVDCGMDSCSSIRSLCEINESKIHETPYETPLKFNFEESEDRGYSISKLIKHNARQRKKRYPKKMSREGS